MAIGITLGIALILIGLTSFCSPLRNWLIKTSNTLQGTKTKITRGTVIWAQVSGLILILFGVGLLYSVLTTQ